jgi:glutamate-ammonia-ligase adenylyltransferase
LRNRSGGLVDLEFIAQALMLREAAQRPDLLRRDTGAAIAALGQAGILEPASWQALESAAQLLTAARVFLTLLCDGVPDEAALAGPLGRTLARCVGAVDFARLDADISAACSAVAFWYDRLIAEPARQAQPSKEGGAAK